MNKKGGFFTLFTEQFIWLYRAVALAVVFILMVLIIRIPINTNTDINDLEHSVLKQRLIYDKNCLAYEDERVYPGVIDLNKFNQERINKCFSTEKYGLKLNLNHEETQTIIVNKNLVDKNIFCFDKKHFACTNTTYYILIKNQSKLDYG